jgi:hypothetical protein
MLIEAVTDVRLAAGSSQLMIKMMIKLGSRS